MTEDTNQPAAQDETTAPFESIKFAILIGLKATPDGRGVLMRKAMTVNGKSLTPDEPAALIAFLASDEAAAITGAVIPIDHGLTC